MIDLNMIERGARYKELEEELYHLHLSEDTHIQKPDFINTKYQVCLRGGCYDRPDDGIFQGHPVSAGGQGRCNLMR